MYPPYKGKTNQKKKNVFHWNFSSLPNYLLDRKFSAQYDNSATTPSTPNPHLKPILQNPHRESQAVNNRALGGVEGWVIAKVKITFLNLNFTLLKT